MIHRCKHGILQYTVVRPLTTVISLYETTTFTKIPLFIIFNIFLIILFKDLRSGRSIWRRQIQSRCRLPLHHSYKQPLPVYSHVPSGRLLPRVPRSLKTDETYRQVSLHQSRRLLFIFVSFIKPSKFLRHVLSFSDCKILFVLFFFFISLPHSQGVIIAILVFTGVIDNWFRVDPQHAPQEIQVYSTN